ncbi:TPA: PD-(D/E)XK nuclease-like domain-containing protein [Enterobacter asburiae]|uniref:RecE family exodeoxyribonuclease n=1 Tax=Enterobacter asburiae TaxID=61645 RepID=UPI001A19EED3|nr:RecE family exodeoxyribonuclease [Enterobacter asburiae]MCS0625302.1 PD-(D/E)XK nuclease-like domain-containing protein [Enterobacter asburiae]HAT7488641.1 exodeoxyribonuclease [Enterobacter asburiae]HAT7510201.1 exodeoxyribonuclease [Enterobacter asburiae]HDR2364437.1 PD-(D/E)XK nuclease-like domain-containing protein [Enterobacter asburiae]
MSEAKPYFIHQKAKKQSGEPHAVFWETAKSESRALRDAENALEDADKDPANYFKAVVTNFPVVNELPPEGEISFTFCNFYQLGDDGMTWQQIPGVTLPAHPGEKVVEGTDTTIVDGVDTATGEIVDEQALNDAGAAPSTNTDLKIDEGDDEDTRYPIIQMSFRKQLLSQLTSDAHRYHLKQGEYHEIARLEMDTDNGYVQNLLLAAASVDKIQQLDIPYLWKYTKAVRDVFNMEKRHELSLVLKFTQVWAGTSHLDRGLLVKEWVKGNRVSEINRTPSGANAGGGIASDRLTPLTKTGRDYEIALGLLAREFEFDIYAPSLEVDAKANAIMNLNWSGEGDVLDEYLATCKMFDDMPGGMDYSRACNIATVKTTPNGLWRDHAKHREHLNRVMTETDHAHPDELVVDIACGRSSLPMPMAGTNDAEQATKEEIDRQLAAGRGEFVPGISDHDDPKWVKTASNDGEKTEVETTSNVQVQTSDSDEEQAGDALPPGEGANCAFLETSVTSNAEILAAAAPHLADQNQTDVNQNADSVSQNSESVNQIEPEMAETTPEATQIEPEQQWPTRFEPGRYENVPNEVYHSANGISSTMLKDARISLMFYNARHVEKTIPREETKAFLFGGHSHAFILEPGKIDAEYAVPVAPPSDLVRTTTDMTAIIKEHNDSLPALMTPDEMKAWIEAHNATLTPPLSLSAGADETANIYMSLPEKFQRIPEGTKHTAAAQKACIKEFNASLPPLLKTSGSREQLLDQIATVSPELAEAERAKPTPLNTSGIRAQLIEAIRQIRPDVVLADDFEAEQERIRAGRTYISLDMYQHVKAIEKAVFDHPSASRLLNHPSRQSEVSYFGFDEDTGLEVRVRPDLELQLPHARIGGDLKTIDLGNVKQERLRDRLHREIIERDYHLSAAMYCDVANLDQFYWIFVNKTPGYHWVVVVEASPDLLALGRLEYRRTLRMINEAMETNTWPAPIVEDYTDELNDFDLRRLEALGAM